MIDQITVFLENKEGHLSKMTRVVGESGASMCALTVADTSDYGIVRILCTEPSAAIAALKAAGYNASLTRVIAVRIEDKPGALADLLEVLDSTEINVEYAYCFMQERGPLAILKVRNANEAVAAINAAGMDTLDNLL